MFGKLVRIEALFTVKPRLRVHLAFALLLFLLTTSVQQVSAQMYPPGGKGAPGEDMFQACGFCHGNQGQGRQRLDAPPIAALPAWYVERQMHNFIDEIT